MSAEAAQVKADAAEAKADAKAAATLKAAQDKATADERAAVGAHVDEILVLRGLARALGHPFATEKLGDLFDALADALTDDEPIDEEVLVDVAIALKDKNHFTWEDMLKNISDLIAQAKVDAAAKKAKKNG